MSWTSEPEPTAEIRRVFTWDMPGTSGVSVSCSRAQEALRRALGDASPGTVGELWGNWLDGTDYVRDRIIGRAERTYEGVWWSPAQWDNS